MTSTPETVVAAVGVHIAPDWDRVVDTIRRSADELVSRAIGIDVTWSTTVVVRGDELESGRARLTTDGLDWERITARFNSDEPESLTLNLVGGRWAGAPDPARRVPHVVGHGARRGAAAARGRVGRLHRAFDQPPEA